MSNTLLFHLREAAPARPHGVFPKTVHPGPPIFHTFHTDFPRFFKLSQRFSEDQTYSSSDFRTKIQEDL